MDTKRPGVWVALACRWERDERIAALTNATKLTYLRGLCLAGEQESDGRIPASLLSHDDRKRARLLVAVGLWIETDTGWAIPFETWSRWQETAEQKRAGRARAAEKRARQRKKSRGTDPTTNGRVPPPSGSGSGSGHSPMTPDPPHDPLIGNRDTEPELWQDPSGRWWIGDPGGEAQ